MTTRIIFDIETNGFLNDLTKIHCLAFKFVTDEEEGGCLVSLPDCEVSIEDGLRTLSTADELIGHNIIKFDIPAIQKVYPWFKPRGRIVDTLIYARLVWPEIKKTVDAKLLKRGTLPPEMFGKHSLEAYGHRLGVWKGDYAEMMKAQGKDPWAEWNPEMQSYCEQDVEVNFALYRKLEAQGYHQGALDLEMKVAHIIARQERWGFSFDRERAEKLYVQLLKDREEIEAKLKAVFKPWYVPKELKTFKRTVVRTRKDLPGSPKEHCEAGAEYVKVELTEFNPGSRHHIANRLKHLYGWKPSEFTDSGEPKVDEQVLGQLDWPEAALLSKYLMITKRIGQVAEGDNAWLKKERNGRIYGSVMTVGAVTRRMTHFDPNVSQVPKIGTPYGEESRGCFKATEGYVLVGADADALELRGLAGYMAIKDGGAYIDTVLKGDKSKGTDLHSVNARALGLDPKKTYNVDGKEWPGREIAKRWFYAFIYGAGDYKLGLILGSKSGGDAVRKAGLKSRKTFLTQLPALGAIVEAVQVKVKAQGYLKGLDGGRLIVRAQHSALNTLLQSAGAIQMKKALVLLDDDLQTSGLSPCGVDYEFCANIHDEWQIDVRPEHTELVKRLAVDAIRKAGEALNFRCPLAGNAAHGRTWADTH